jgi:hypothetical protein
MFHSAITRQLLEDRRNQLVADAARSRMVAAGRRAQPRPLANWLRRRTFLPGANLERTEARPPPASPPHLRLRHRIATTPGRHVSASSSPSRPRPSEGVALTLSGCVRAGGSHSRC